jgi:hypothetical protein
VRATARPVFSATGSWHRSATVAAPRQRSSPYPGGPKLRPSPPLPGPSAGSAPVLAPASSQTGRRHRRQARTFSTAPMEDHLAQRHAATRPLPAADAQPRACRRLPQGLSSREILTGIWPPDVSARLQERAGFVRPGASRGAWQPGPGAAEARDRRPASRAAGGRSASRTAVPPGGISAALTGAVPSAQWKERPAHRSRTSRGNVQVSASGPADARHRGQSPHVS